MKGLILFLTLFGFINQASAQLVRISQDQIREERICRGLYCEIVQKPVTFWWSGSIVGRTLSGDVAILTCAHEYNKSKPVTVWFDPTTYVDGKIELLDRAADLGGISFKSEKNPDFYSVAAGPPGKGSTIKYGGYGPGTKMWKSAKYLGSDNYQMSISQMFRQGDSGGIIMNDHDEQIGVIQANTLTNGVGASTDSMNRFLTTWIRRRPAPVEPVPVEPELGEPGPKVPDLTPIKNDIINGVKEKIQPNFDEIKSVILGRVKDVIQAEIHNPEFLALFSNTGLSFLPALLGIGGPVGAGLGLATWFLNRSIKKIKTGDNSEVVKQLLQHIGSKDDALKQLIEKSHINEKLVNDLKNMKLPENLVKQIITIIRDKPFPIYDQLPPAPQQVVETTQYMPIEKNTHNEAYNWAKKELSRTDPTNMESVFGRIDSLISQYMSGVK